MNPPDTIVCKPTPWFLFRALVMLLMFGVFSVLFYLDGSTGYRKKNVEFFLHQTFQRASDDFSRMNSDGELTPEVWKPHAEAQSVIFPKDRSILPADIALPMKWPEILHDFDKVKPLQWKKLWLEYSKEQGYNSEPVEEAYTARKIYEQWVVFWICLALSVGALFFLIRTLGRSIQANAEGVTTQQGKSVRYTDFKTLDLRKWDTKGLAFIDYDGPSGKGRIRIDGLTYGGFKKDQGEPAEALMRKIRAHFSGEILEYAPLAAEIEPPDGQNPA